MANGTFTHIELGELTQEERSKIDTKIRSCGLKSGHKRDYYWVLEDQWYLRIKVKKLKTIKGIMVQHVI